MPVVAWAAWPTGARTRAAGSAVVTDVTGHASIEGSEVRTGPGGAARATLATGAVVEMSEASHVRFESESGAPWTGDRVELAAGRIQVSVPKLGPGHDLRVRTELATVIVHGTRFAVVSEKDATRVSVTEGLVEVDSKTGVRMLTAGMSVVVPAGAAAPPETSSKAALPAAPDEPTTRTTGATSTLAAENALLAEAMRLRRDRQSARAIELLDELLARYPASPLVETAKVERLRALADLRDGAP